MKKLLYLLPVCLFLFAFSCENEELNEDIELQNPVVTDPVIPDPGSGPDPDPDPTPDPDPDPGTASIVGTWDLIEFSFDFTSSTDFDGQVIESIMIGELTESDFSVEFTETNYNGVGSYSYDVSGNVNNTPISTTNYSLTDVNTTGNYSVDGNSLTTDGQLYEFDFGDAVEAGSFDGPQTAEFELSADGNTLTFNQNETTVNNENGIEVTTTNVSTSVYQRVE